MSSNVTYVELSGASSKATLGLYAGMQPQELQQIVRNALNKYDGVCAGFQVVHETSLSGRTKSSLSSIPRLVPLSVACKAPELLVGNVCALFGPIRISQKTQNEVWTTLIGTERLQKLLETLESEKKLHSSDIAVLIHLCEQQIDQVLDVMSNTSSMDEKKAFLVQMLHSKEAKELRPFKTRLSGHQTKESLHIDVVAKKLAAIGTSVFSPPIQTQVLALADEVKHFWKTGEMKSRLIDTMELFSMIEKLLEKHMVSQEHGARLLNLVLGNNRMLWSALQSYKKEIDSDMGLKAAVKRLAALEFELHKPIASKKNKGKSPRKETKQGSFVTRKKVRNAAAVTAAISTAIGVVISLHAQHMLTSMELDVIKTLIKQEDSQVLHILRTFEESGHRDVGALRDALVSVVEEITMELGDEEKAAAGIVRGLGDAVLEESQWNDNSHNNGSLEWQRHLSFLLGQWQTQQQLTPADASALRRLVFQRHNLLESAYEVFADDGDASELLDTLQRVAKLQRQIEQSSQVGQNGVSGAPASGMTLEDVVREMQRRGVLQSGDAAGLLVLFYGENEALKAANEAFQADGDVHELEETLLLVVKHARFGREIEKNQPIDEDQTVCRLLADFGRSESLEVWQIQLLILLLKSHDPRLLAAVDVYNEDQDTDELLETLEILVELAAWELHRGAMVHDWIPLLVQSGKLTRSAAERLVQMTDMRDDRIVAALVILLSDNNKEEFVDTLARIAFLKTTKPLDAEADTAKEDRLVLDLLKEVEDKGIVSAEECKQMEDLVYSKEPQMLAAVDILAMSHDAEKFACVARQVLAKAKDQVNDRNVTENTELEEAKLSSEAPMSSLDGEVESNDEEMGTSIDDDAKDDELNAQDLEESEKNDNVPG